MKPAIHVNHNNLFIDEPVHVHVSGLSPNESYTVKAMMRDNFGNGWSSHVVLKSNEHGEIDVAKAKPSSGTYEEADVNGLIWSMKRLPNDTIKKRTPLQPLKTIFTLEKEGEELARSSVKRQVISANINRQPIREQGLVGTFFYHPEKDAL